MIIAFIMINNLILRSIRSSDHLMWNASYV